MTKVEFETQIMNIYSAYDFGWITWNKANDLLKAVLQIYNALND